MARCGVPARTLRRRFTLGSGPLKRTSDRVEVLSRVLLALVLLLAAPLGALAGAVSYADVHAAAAAQAAARHQEQATLLADAPAAGSFDVYLPAAATWAGPGGARLTGAVEAPTGARAGAAVVVWVNRAGRLTTAPLTDRQVLGQAVVVGALSCLGVAVAGTSGHLVVLWLLERRRLRRWAAGWASVEPLWVSRFR